MNDLAYRALKKSLTGRDREIISLMSADLSNAEIAQRLHLAASTVKWYVKQIYSKLDAHDRDAAIEKIREFEASVRERELPFQADAPVPAATILLERHIL